MWSGAYGSGQVGYYFGSIENGWRPTWAHLRAVALAGLGPLYALAFHRPDVLVASTPFVIIAGWGIVTRPSGELRATQRLSRTSLREGEALELRCEVTATAGTQEVSVAYQRHPWVRTRPRGGVRTALVSGEQPTFEVDTTARMVRWGHHGVGTGSVGALSCWGAYQCGPLELEERDVEVIPAAPVFDARAPMPHPQGVVGVDRSARPGDGSEFATIRQFQLGDRLRRIHWPSSLRSRSLNVSSTYADHDSQVLVYVDAANDLGISGGIDGPPNTLDLTVRAAAALCEHYARRGDRVGLQVSRSRAAVLIPPSAGRGHLRRILSALADIRPGDLLGDSGDPRLRINPGAVVIMCSPLVSPTAMQRAVSLSGRGLTLVIIDTLPRDLVMTTETVDDETDEVTMLAWRMRMLERAVDIRRVTQAGIPVVPWRGPGSLDQVLRDVARRSRAPRLVSR